MQRKSFIVPPDTSYPTIKPVPNESPRPFWSVMIPTYNCTEYLVKALKSVLSQDEGPKKMQIAVVDDCSTKDDPEEVVRSIGKGRVEFFRQPANVGAPANFTHCIRQARGHWVHILHGDDEVLPGFYRKYRQMIESYACIMVVGRSVLIDENNFWRSICRPLQKEEGLLENAHFLLSIANETRTPSVIVAREAYEKEGGFHRNLIHCADWDMWARVAAFGPVCYVPRPYTLYREHSASDTTKLADSGLDITDALRALENIASRFNDPRERKKVTSLGHMWIGFDSLYQGLTLIRQRRITSALRHFGFCLRLSPSILKNRRHLGRLLF